MVTVFHVAPPFLTFNSNPAPFPDTLIKVAEVETNELEVAFRLTNSIDSYWVETAPSNVKVMNDEFGHRSTSVGDLMEKDGVYYIVASVGYQVLYGYQVPA